MTGKRGSDKENDNSKRKSFKKRPDFKGKPRFADSDGPKRRFKKPGHGSSKYDKESPKKQEFEFDSNIRLNRFIAHAGICSRREADEYIKAGVVSVNGKIITELGVKVSVTDAIRFNGRIINSEKPTYVLLNKPKDFVTTMEDPHATKTVIDLIKSGCKERVYPVGRLDKNTTGVLLLTNDGDLSSKLTHPKYEKMKIYHVVLEKNLKSSDYEKIIEGFSLDDGPFKVDAINYIDKEDHKQLGIEIHSGRNRIVRRIFESLGYKVRKLDRVYFAGLTKKGIPRGKWRFLDDKEIAMLKMGSFK